MRLIKAVQHEQLFIAAISTISSGTILNSYSTYSYTTITNYGVQVAVGLEHPC